MSLLTEQEYDANFKLDVSKYIEERNNGTFTAKYISWANAQLLLKTRHPGLSVDFDRIDGNPAHGHGQQSFVSAFLTNGEERSPSIYYPVWDNRFNPIANASVWDINNACQRATAKAIAIVTGIGLCCYVGEDLQDNPNDHGFQNDRQRYQSVNAENSEYTEHTSWKDITCPLKKHQGKTWLWVADNDPHYITDWLLGDKFEFKSEAMKNTCLEAFDYINSKKVESEETADKSAETTEKEEEEDDVPF